MSIAAPAPDLEPRHDPPPRAAQPVRLGEELPLFCERCGYQLHGLPPVRCLHCQVLHFACPECGHHQPLNTLRPAAQRILGRLRAVALVWSIFFRLNFFGWLLFAWGAMGYEWSYRYHFAAMTTASTPGQPRMGPRTYELRPREMDIESLLAFTIFALAFGLVSRIFLLRWRRSWAVGLILSAIVVTAITLGAYFRQWEREITAGPFSGGDLPIVLALTFATLIAGIMLSWPLWVMLVRMFLPARTATALLDWQRSLAGPVDQLAREEITRSG
jgi:hypothetical protein